MSNSAYADNRIARSLARLEVPVITLGDLPITALSRAEAAERMIAIARAPRRGRPLYLGTVNGEVIAKSASDAELRDILMTADELVADGQPMVFASRFLCARALPERVCTTDFFHDVATWAQVAGVTFYMLGATEDEVTKAVAGVRRLYPELRIVGFCHGYLKGEALEEKLAEINALAPDILWVGMGVPYEQRFVRDHAAKLPNVAIIKTAGGLFNYLSGTNRRAPLWMRAVGLEWLFRLWLEPNRLFWRYVTTNPKAIYLLLTRSR